MQVCMCVSLCVCVCACVCVLCVCVFVCVCVHACADDSKLDKVLMQAQPHCLHHAQTQHSVYATCKALGASALLYAPLCEALIERLGLHQVWVSYTQTHTHTHTHTHLQGRLLVGHGLSNDLKAMMLDHPRKDIRDTARWGAPSHVLPTKLVFKTYLPLRACSPCVLVECEASLSLLV